MIFENSQLFFIILLFLWLIFVLEYLDNRKSSNNKMISITQFGFMFPLEIILADISFNYPFGFIIVFLIPILSLYLLADSLIYNKK